MESSSLVRNRYSDAPQLVALARQDCAAALALIDASIQEIMARNEFIHASLDSSPSQIHRPFFVRQVMNLGSEDPLKRISAITTVVVCVLTVVGLIFFLAAIPTHLHYLKEEARLAGLKQQKHHLTNACSLLDRLVPQTGDISLADLAPVIASISHNGAAAYLGRTTGRRHLEGAAETLPPLMIPGGSRPSLEADPLSQMPSFRKFITYLEAERGVVARANPAEGDHYNSLEPLKDGKTMDQRLISSIQLRARRPSDLLVEGHPITLFRFEKVDGMTNGFILQVYHPHKAERPHFLEIWFPDAKARQDLTKYQILHINLTNYAETVKPVTIDDVKALMRFIQDKKVVTVTGSTPMEPLAAAGPVHGAGTKVLLS